MTLSKEQAERYSRQILLREVGVSGQKKLLSSSVLVIGAGGLGSAVLMYLSAAGIGKIGVVDYDRVELSNLHRQIIHRTGSVGEFKAESAARTMREISPDLNVNVYTDRVTAYNIQKIIEPYDFVIDCTDRFGTKFLINDACVLSAKPYSHAGVVRFGGQVMTYVPGRGPCLRCLLGDVPPPEECATCADVGVLGSVIGVIGSVQATEAVKYLLGIGNLLTGKVFTFDGLAMRTRIVDTAETDISCQVCGERPLITSLADENYERV